MSYLPVDYEDNCTKEMMDHKYVGGRLGLLW